MSSHSPAGTSTTPAPPSESTAACSSPCVPPVASTMFCAAAGAVASRVGKPQSSQGNVLMTAHPISRERSPPIVGSANQPKAAVDARQQREIGHLVPLLVAQLEARRPVAVAALEQSAPRHQPKVDSIA